MSSLASRQFVLASFVSVSMAACGAADPPAPQPAPTPTASASAELSASSAPLAAAALPAALPPAPAERRVLKLAAGDDTTCALLDGGVVHCVRFGTPSAIEGLADATDVGVGDGFACALHSKGKVACWGNGHDGVLGNGDTSDGSGGKAASYSAKALAVDGLGEVSKLFVGKRNVCVLDERARVSCWGANQSGQLGDGTRVDRGRPVRVTGLDGALKVAITTHEICGLTKQAQVDCVDDNGAINEYSPLRGALTLDGGDISLCAAFEDGAVRCWDELSRSGSAVRMGGKTVQSLPPVSDVQRDGEDAHACALGRDGGVYCWGHNLAGELGQCTSKKADFYESKKPLRVPGIEHATQIAVARHRTCALLADASVRCWGIGRAGELADGAFADSAAPRVASFDPPRPPHCVSTAMGSPIGSAKVLALAVQPQSLELEIESNEQRVCYRVDKTSRASVAIACPDASVARQALPEGVRAVLRRNDESDERAGDLLWTDAQGKPAIAPAPRCVEPSAPAAPCP